MVAGPSSPSVLSTALQVRVSQAVLGYMMDIVEATRRENRFAAGVSTRGAMALYKACQVTAALRGREYVIPEDVKYVAPFVLGHRIATGHASGTAAAEAFRQILEQVPVPLEDVI